MKQVVRSLGTGEVRVAEVPVPQLRPGGIRVRTHFSVLSPGTERMKVEQGRRSLLGKALDRPDDVKKVLETVRREGLRTAFQKVEGKLSSLTTLGYAASGVVEGVGDGVTGFQVGDRVACAGEGYAAHAEVLWVPEKLAVRVPDAVPLDEAAFATLGAIALHGVRQGDLRVGECAVVVGLGLVGQLTLQLLEASGVRAVGVDLAPERVAMAQGLGYEALLSQDDLADELTRWVWAHSRGVGADAVFLTATTTSRAPMELAIEVARDRGRIVVVGQVPVEAPRARLQAKELELRMSRSYGPGRYDPSYEERGVDYPVGYVRWTENRNLEAFLGLAARGALKLGGLVTHRIPFAEAEAAYDALLESQAGMAMVLEYPLNLGHPAPEPAVVRVAPSRVKADRRHPGTASAQAAPRRAPVRLGFVGAGSFAVGTLLPTLARLATSHPLVFQGVTTAGGTSALSAAEKFGIRGMVASPEALFSDPDIDAVVIATRHNDHARLAAMALEAGKSVYLEKPLALNAADLAHVVDAARRAASADYGPILQVGFNRRFAPATQALLRVLDGMEGAPTPRVVQIRVNAGAIPADSWIHDLGEGGGRIAGEACHFVDLGLLLAGHEGLGVGGDRGVRGDEGVGAYADQPVPSVHTTYLGGGSPEARLRDNAQLTVSLPGGALVSILYTAVGDPRFGKERIEVFAGGGTAILDDFRRLDVVGMGRSHRSGAVQGLGALLTSMSPLALSGSGAPVWKGAQDKGHLESLRRFIDAVANGHRSPTPLETLEATTRITLTASGT
jgi:predicted dehydrogenase/threonine dehydrogenase-like Zn-dependent dehydrogenase